MIGVALASLLVGGLAGGAVVAASGDDDHGRVGFMRMGPNGEMPPPGWRRQGPRRFDDGSPKWHRNDGPQPPETNTTPDDQPTPTPSPTE